MDAVLVVQVDHGAILGAHVLYPLNALADQGEDSLQGMDAVVLPVLGHGGEDVADGTELVTVVDVRLQLLLVAHGGGGDELGALVMPLDQSAQVFLVVGHGLVDEQGDAGLDEGAHALHVLKALVGGADDSVYLTDHLLGAVTHIGDKGGLGATLGGGAVLVTGEADVSDFGAGDAQSVGGLLVQIGGDGGVVLGTPFAHLVLVIAVEHGAPGEGMGITLGKAEHADLQFFVAQREIAVFHK